MKTTFKLHLILLLAVGAILAACSKEGTTPENNKGEEKVSNDNQLRNFGFQKGSNPSLTANCFATVAGDILYITVPEGVALNTLVPSFSVHEKASVKAGSAAKSYTQRNQGATSLIMKVVFGE